MAEDRVGQQLGNYRLTQQLGEGGFAEVYLGEHIYLKTQAAMKILHTRLGKDDLDGFISEAQTIARLKHPHIVRVLEFGVEGSTPFLVMDYAPNGTLRQRHPKGTRLAPATILSYVKQVAEALSYAHEQKLVHRDVKPENMLIGERGEVLLSDFGIATVAQSSRYQGTQEVAGTVTYMAPEQVQGKPRPASDQYSLGIVIYEWLSGGQPFRGSFTEIATQHVLAPPPSLSEKLPDIAPALEAVVMTALAKDPKERFASIQAFVNAFEQACQAAASQAVQPPAWETQPMPDAAARPAEPSDPSFFSAPTRITPPSSPAPTFQTPTKLAPPVASTPPNAAPGAPTLAAATPPGWKDVAAPAPADSAETFGVLLPDSPAPIQQASVTPRIKRPRLRSPRRRVIVGSLLLALILIAAGSAWLLIFQPFKFNQEVHNGEHIFSLHVGAGFDSASAKILGETDTFKVGDTVYIAFSTGVDISTEKLELDLIHNGSAEKIPNLQAPLTQANVYWSFAPISSTTTPGVYKWVVYYFGSADASITFQVVP
ncbi:MAG TPA: protein kinase [Ktedonobacterales bacterium]|jgi:serine/threonine protein kinase